MPRRCSFRWFEVRGGLRHKSIGEGREYLHHSPLAHHPNQGVEPPAGRPLDDPVHEYPVPVEQDGHLLAGTILRFHGTSHDVPNHAQVTGAVLCGRTLADTAVVGVVTDRRLLPTGHDVGRVLAAAHSDCNVAVVAGVDYLDFKRALATIEGVQGLLGAHSTNTMIASWSGIRAQTLSSVFHQGGHHLPHV